MKIKTPQFILLLCLLFSAAANSAPGDLDSRFGLASEEIGITQGYIELPDMSPRRFHRTYRNVDIGVDTQQHIYVGEAWHPDYSSTSARVFIRRTNRHGLLDTAFGNGTSVRTPIHVGSENVLRPTIASVGDAPRLAMAVYYPPEVGLGEVIFGDPTRIYQAVAVGNEVTVISYNSNGDLDARFANGRGKATFLLNGPFGSAIDIIIHQNIITVVGSAFDHTAGLYRMLIIRLGLDGNPMRGFGSHNNGIGYFAIDEAASNSLVGIKANPVDGKLYVIGRVRYAGRDDVDLVVGRLDANGYPDPDFGPKGSGFFAHNNPRASEWATGLAIQPSGRIIVSGYEEISNEETNFATGNVWRFDDGRLDSLFGNFGRTEIVVSPYLSLSPPADLLVIHDIAALPNGRFFVGGGVIRTYPSKTPGESAYREHGLVAHLDAQGGIVPSFGNNLTVGGISEATYTNSCYKIAVVQDGLVCLGSEWLDFRAAGRLRIMKFQR